MVLKKMYGAEVRFPSQDELLERYGWYGYWYDVCFPLLMNEVKWEVMDTLKEMNNRGY